MKELLTREELETSMKVSRGTIHNWVKKGMPCVTKKPYRYDLEKVIEWVNTNK